MKAELIAVGTELLLGQIVNTNVAYLSERLAEMGIHVYFQTVVGDNKNRLQQVLQIAKERSDLIILCGGLGPTEDDITKEAVAHFLNKKLVQDPLALEKLQTYFKNKDYMMPANNLRQTLIIEDGIAVQNPVGLAVGTFTQVDGAGYLLLPGPPNELKAMFDKEVCELLEIYCPSNERLFHQVLRFCGIGESQLVTELAGIIADQENPSIAPYAKPNEVTLRLTAKADSQADAQKLLQPVREKILAQVGQYYYGDGEDNSLVKVVVTALKSQNKTITAAESLTAGLFQSILGSIAGVSAVFKGGFVTYSAETKSKFLGIDAKLLQEVGTVSEMCATMMAERAREITDADYGLSFTGVAGPDSLENQTVGTVWIALAIKDEPTQVKKFQFAHRRDEIRQSAVAKGLEIVRNALLK